MLLIPLLADDDKDEDEQQQQQGRAADDLIVVVVVVGENGGDNSPSETVPTVTNKYTSTSDDPLIRFVVCSRLNFIS
jgi:hypothetical protein